MGLIVAGGVRPDKPAVRAHVLIFLLILVIVDPAVMRVVAGRPVPLERVVAEEAAVLMLIMVQAVVAVMQRWMKQQMQVIAVDVV